MKLKRSTYEVLQILSISFTNKTHLRDLFDKTDFNDVKLIDYPLFKGLIDYFLTRPFLLDTNETIYIFDINDYLHIKTKNIIVILQKELHN